MIVVVTHNEKEEDVCFAGGIFLFGFYGVKRYRVMAFGNLIQKSKPVFYEKSLLQKSENDSIMK